MPNGQQQEELNIKIATMTWVTFFLIFSVMTEAFSLIRACPEPEGACSCNAKKKTVTCLSLGSSIRRIPIGIPITTKRLIVNYSSLRKLGSHAFRGSYNLEYLDLNFNLIDDISEYCFQSLGKLDTLLLSSNRIRFLDSNVFINLKSLRVLDLSKNRIIVLAPTNFVYLRKLKHLLLHQNPIMCIAPDAFRQLFFLSSLTVSNTSANLNDELFKDLIDLKRISISYIPSLKSFPNKLLTNNLKLRELKLEDLRALNIEGIPKNILEKHENVRVISFSGCNFSRVPSKVLSHVKWSVRFLDLSRNPIYSIGEKDLKFLYVLETLILRQTGLLSIKENALKLSSILTIDLSGNRLTTLKEKVFGNTGIPGTIKSIKFGNNPWICDCELKWLSYYKSLQTGVEAICMEPNEMQGEDVFNGSHEDDYSNRFQCQAPNITNFGYPLNSQNVVKINTSEYSTELKFPCQAVGYPRPTVRWVLLLSSSINIPDLSTFENVQQNLYLPIKQSCDVCERSTKHQTSNIFVEADGTLTIKASDPRDATGLLVCVAENLIGTDKKMLWIRKNRKVNTNLLEAFSFQKLFSNTSETSSSKLPRKIPKTNDENRINYNEKHQLWPPWESSVVQTTNFLMFKSCVRQQPCDVLIRNNHFYGSQRVNKQSVTKVAQSSEQSRNKSAQQSVISNISFSQLTTFCLFLELLKVLM